MFRLLSVVIFIALTALIVGGALEVKFHPAKLAEVPAKVLSLATNKEMHQSIRAKVTGAKRASEQWLIKDEDKRRQLAIAYIKIDAERLSNMMTENADRAPGLVPQAELLLSSIERVADDAGTLSADKLTQGSLATKEALLAASLSLSELKVVQAQYRALHQRFAAVTQRLEVYVGKIKLKDTPEQDSAVAGSRDAEAIKITPTPRVPLSF